MLTLDELLLECVKRSGLALHVNPGKPPRIRTAEGMRRISPSEVEPEESQLVCESALSEFQQAELHTRGYVDCTYNVRFDNRQVRFRGFVARADAGTFGIFTLPGHDWDGRPNPDMERQMDELERKLRDEPGEFEGGSGGSPVLAPLLPGFPPRAGHDAKQPPVDGFNDDNLAAQ